MSYNFHSFWIHFWHCLWDFGSASVHCRLWCQSSSTMF